MEGTITQLGLKNYLINNNQPKESFFKHTYKNYYNFAKDTRILQFDNTVDFSKDISIKLSDKGRYGDLINNMILELDLPNLSNILSNTNNQVGYCNGVGYAIIKEAILKVGGYTINTISGEWMHTWTRLCIARDKQDVFNDSIKYFTNNLASNFKGGIVHIPLTFWFCQLLSSNLDPSLSFPLVAMRNAEVELVIKLRSLSDVIVTNDNSTITNTNLNIVTHGLLVDYIILTPEERMKYINAKKQMYLINQIQQNTYTIDSNSSVANINLRNFKYPITELLWVFRPINNLNKNDYFNYTTSFSGDPQRGGFYTSAKLTFDGRDRIPELHSLTFTNDEPIKSHTNVPLKSQISCYSFALEPENISQPSGSCNFSELHEPRLTIKMRSDISIPACELIIFAINYNVLQIDDKGNVWLLHNMSKSAPGTLPDLSKGMYLDECNLTVKESRNAKELIAEINKLNLFTDPRTIETGLQNIINDAKINEIKNGRVDPTCINLDEGNLDSGTVNPLLTSLRDEVKRINQVLLKARKSDSSKVFTDDTKRFIDVGGQLINIEDFNTFLRNVLARTNYKL